VPAGGRAFRRDDGRPFAIAGLWENWVGPDGLPLETCALLTTEANAVVRPVHDRMPVLRGVSDFDRWLAADATPADLVPLLRPAPDDGLAALAVGPFVNSARHEGPGCVEPPGEAPLFERPPN
jgi:putative SOS response-associated peptidase YedK